MTYIQPRQKLHPSHWFQLLVCIHRKMLWCERCSNLHI